MYKLTILNEGAWNNWSGKKKEEVDYFWIARPGEFPAVLMYVFERDDLFRYYISGYWVYESDFTSVTSTSPIRFEGVQRL